MTTWTLSKTHPISIIQKYENSTPKEKVVFPSNHYSQQLRERVIFYNFDWISSRKGKVSRNRLFCSYGAQIENFEQQKNGFHKQLICK